MKSKVKVELLGQQFTLGGDDDYEHLSQVADYVKQKIGEVGAGTRSIGPTKIALLTAINIASDYYKTLEENKNIKKEVLHRSKALMKILEEAL